MKRFISICVCCICMCLSSCSGKHTIESSVSKEEETKKIDETKSEDYDFHANLDLTSIVSDIIDNYDSYKAFALKHGMIYTNGVKTDKSPCMEEISGYVYGVDKVEADELEYEYYDYDILPLEETDVDNLCELYKDYSDDDLIGEMIVNQYVDVDISDMPYYEYDNEDDILRSGTIWLCQHIKFPDNLSDLNDITEEKWNTMPHEEKVLYTARYMSYMNILQNEIIEGVNKSNEELKGKIRSVKRKSDDNSAEYQSWYYTNQSIINTINLIDFTAEKSIPDYITVDNHAYYMTKEQMRSLWEEQGSPENKKISIQVYGYGFIHDISNYDF